MSDDDSMSYLMHQALARELAAELAVTLGQTGKALKYQPEDQVNYLCAVLRESSTLAFCLDIRVKRLRRCLEKLNYACGQ